MNGASEPDFDRLRRLNALCETLKDETESARVLSAVETFQRQVHIALAAHSKGTRIDANNGVNAAMDALLFEHPYLGVYKGARLDRRGGGLKIGYVQRAHPVSSDASSRYEKRLRSMPPEGGHMGLGLPNRSGLASKKNDAGLSSVRGGPEFLIRQAAPVGATWEEFQALTVRAHERLNVDSWDPLSFGMADVHELASVRAKDLNSKIEASILMLMARAMAYLGAQVGPFYLKGGSMRAYQAQLNDLLKGKSDSFESRVLIPPALDALDFVKNFRSRLDLFLGLLDIQISGKKDAATALEAQTLLKKLSLDWSCLKEHSEVKLYVGDPYLSLDSSAYAETDLWSVLLALPTKNLKTFDPSRLKREIVALGSTYDIDRQRRWAAGLAPVQTQLSAKGDSGRVHLYPAQGSLLAHQIDGSDELNFGFQIGGVKSLSLERPSL